jgi:PKHD-type hydroxylase
MRYGCPYKVIQLDDQSMNLVRRAINSTELSWEESSVHYEVSNRKPRQSEVAWINDRYLDNLLLKYAQYVNTGCGWNLNITDIEPVQFGSYPVGGFYDWHVDQHSVPEKVVRKLSMSLFLNEDYTGGEFDIEIYKPGTEPRFDTIKSKTGSAVFFQGDQWHRVRPVTSGLRKSLVAWFVGPPYV